MRGISLLSEEILTFKTVAIYLLTYTWCFNDAVSNSDYITSNGRVC